MIRRCARAGAAPMRAPSTSPEFWCSGGTVTETKVWSSLEAAPVLCHLAQYACHARIKSALVVQVRHCRSGHHACDDHRSRPHQPQRLQSLFALSCRNHGSKLQNGWNLLPEHMPTQREHLCSLQQRYDRKRPQMQVTERAHKDKCVVCGYRAKGHCRGMMSAVDHGAIATQPQQCSHSKSATATAMEP